VQAEVTGFKESVATVMRDTPTLIIGAKCVMASNEVNSRLASLHRAETVLYALNRFLWDFLPQRALTTTTRQATSEVSFAIVVTEA
jgi:hypothetical protein